MPIILGTEQIAPIPSVPYGWQPVGERIEIPSRRSRQINVLGFLGYDGELTPYVTEGTVDSQIVVACMEHFSKKIEGRPSIVVIDNASPHTSAAFEACRPAWEERGMYLYFLPPYCPELNLIEILWRMIKYHWLPARAYTSFKTLLDSLDHILTNVGSEYNLNFA